MAEKISKLINETIGWHDITVGAIINESGTSKEFNTGDWRVASPEFIEEKCKQCLMCVAVCPDSSIPVINGKRTDFDMMHCKGCGICAKICSFGAIVMKRSDE